VFEQLNRPPGPATRVAKDIKPTVWYLFQVEVHVYAFSMAANVLLSFFPFLIVMVSLCRYVFQWEAAEDAIFLALREYFPDPLGSFIRRNLNATVMSRGPFQAVSVLLLLYTANGIFEPLEVALNRAWGIVKNRSYFKNQLISFGLILLCGAFGLASAVFTGFSKEMGPTTFSEGVVFRMLVVPLTIVLLFLIYWLLPNGKVPWRPIVPVAVVVGVLLEVLKYLNLITWPWLRAKLEMEYGPFVYSVTIILWGFLSSMLVLAGAEWSARSRGATDEPEAVADEGG
jgi:YihY family inner membrane protein